MIQNTVIVEAGQSRILSGVLLNSKLVTGPYMPVTMQTIFSKYSTLDDFGTKIKPSNVSWTVDIPAVLSIAPEGQDCLITGISEGIAVVTCTVNAPILRTTTVRVVVLQVDPQPTLIIIAGPVQ